MDRTPAYQPEKAIKLISPLEVALEIDNNLNLKKVPGVDEILSDLRKAIIMLTYSR